jgi:hypothetical protein
MNYEQWRAKSELILNQMEHVHYKSGAYFALKAKLENHLCTKPLQIDDTNDQGWVMSGPAPLDSEIDTAFITETGRMGESLPTHAGFQPNAAMPKKVGLIIHNIKPDQIRQLEKIFGKRTASGLAIPRWLVRLKETVIERDFETTSPPVSDA